jgi:hypothetical protein
MYASLKRNVLRCLLKQSTEDEARMSSGSEFHRKGPALTKARSPDVFPRVYGTSRRPSYQISTNSNQGRRELGGGPGRQIFLGAPISKFFWTTTTFPPPPPRRQLFWGKKFTDENVVIAIQRLYLKSSYQISLICPKKQISCSLRGNISPKK